MDYDAELIRWFDEHLKGESNKSTLPAVSVFVMGSNQWRTEKEWPLSRAVPTSYYLQGSGSKKAGALSTTAPGNDASDSYLFDPANPFWDKSYEKSYPYDQKENEARADVHKRSFDGRPRNRRRIGL
jgi:putative CocE/NonD family hydrolase